MMMTYETYQRLEDNTNCYSKPIDLNEIPIDALQPKTKQELSKLLNQKMHLLSDEGCFRDWRGLADRIGLDYSTVNNIKTNEMDHLLRLWSKEKVKDANLGKLQSYMGAIDRYDAVDDTNQLFLDDASAYLTKMIQRKRNEIAQSESGISHSSDLVYECIVKEDIESLKTGSKKTRFDAFLLHSIEDTEFAFEIVDELERRGYKICLKDRDFIGGIFIQHTAVIDMIKERCDSLIIVVSPAFLCSPDNDFFTNYALALGIERNRHNIIPCIYEYCLLPEMLRFSSHVQYQSSFYNFWSRLEESIQRAKLENYQIKRRLGSREIERGENLAITRNRDRVIITEINNSVEINNSENSARNIPAIQMSNNSQKKEDKIHITEIIDKFPKINTDTEPFNRSKSRSLLNLNLLSSSSMDKHKLKDDVVSKSQLNLRKIDFCDSDAIEIQGKKHNEVKKSSSSSPAKSPSSSPTKSPCSSPPTKSPKSLFSLTEWFGSKTKDRHNNDKINNIVLTNDKIEKKSKKKKKLLTRKKKQPIVVGE